MRRFPGSLFIKDRLVRTFYPEVKKLEGSKVRSSKKENVEPGQEREEGNGGKKRRVVLGAESGEKAK